MQANKDQKLHKIGFGGGCHWCTEGIFVSLQGVKQVQQGWIAGPAPDDDFSEAVIVHFDPKAISLNDLITIHLETHASSSDHPLRAKYRSAVYAFNAREQNHYQSLLQNYSQRQLVTRVIRFVAFRASEEKYQDYYRKNPEKPFCQTYISPKLQEIRKQYPTLMK